MNAFLKVVGVLGLVVGTVAAVAMARKDSTETSGTTEASKEANTETTASKEA